MNSYDLLNQIIADLNGLIQDPGHHILSHPKDIDKIQLCNKGLDILHSRISEIPEIEAEEDYSVAMLRASSQALNEILNIDDILTYPNELVHARLKQVSNNLISCREDIKSWSADTHQLQLNIDRPNIDQENAAPEDPPVKPSLKGIPIKAPIQNQIFISYSRKDAEWLDRLKTILKPLELKYRLNIWSDKKIRPGDKWQDEIDTALAAAKLAILLVSPDFLSSDFVVKHELPYLLHASETRGLRILWIQLRHCMYQETELNQIQSAGDPATPLDSLEKSEADKLLVEIGKLIKETLEV